MPSWFEPMQVLCWQTIPATVELPCSRQTTVHTGEAPHSGKHLKLLQPIDIVIPAANIGKLDGITYQVLNVKLLLLFNLYYYFLFSWGPFIRQLNDVQ